jgi:acyl-CoA synthetase (AMP-forming)/AMP-acid ligase II
MTTNLLFDTESFADLVRRRAAVTPSALLLVDEHSRRFTFADLAAETERLAAGLMAAGVRPGDVVSWQLPTSWQTVVVTSALSRLGVVQNPLVTSLREREIEYITREAGSTWFIVGGVHAGVDHSAMAARVAEANRVLRVLSMNSGLPDGDPSTLPTPYLARSDETRWLFYTSGTTSAPKGARHSDRAIIAGSTTFCTHLRVHATDQIACLSPMGHVMGVTHIVNALQTGCSLVVSATFDRATTIDFLAAQRITLLGSGVPFIVAYLARQRAQPDRPLFKRIRAALCGGSGRLPSLHEQVKTELGGVGIISGYGLTECPSFCWGGPDESDEQHAISEGRPGPGGDVKVVRADGTRAENGAEGELRIRGPQLMLGYVDPKLDAAAFDDEGYFRTGDLGHIDTDGVVTVTARLKDIIIRKMENISASEVEQLLAGCTGVKDVAVIGLPDDETGERACAVVVPTDPRKPPMLDELTNQLRAMGLSIRKLPEQLEIIDSLPRNAMNKVVKRELQQRYANTRVSRR